MTVSFQPFSPTSDFKIFYSLWYSHRDVGFLWNIEASHRQIYHGLTDFASSPSVRWWFCFLRKGGARTRNEEGVNAKGITFCAQINSWLIVSSCLNLYIKVLKSSQSFYRLKRALSYLVIYLNVKNRKYVWCACSCSNIVCIPMKNVTTSNPNIGVEAN